jgi:hypothetical protein
MTAKNTKILFVITKESATSEHCAPLKSDILAISEEEYAPIEAVFLNGNQHPSVYEEFKATHEEIVLVADDISGGAMVDAAHANNFAVVSSQSMPRLIGIWTSGMNC